MEMKFVLGLVCLFPSYRWKDSFLPGSSVRHLLRGNASLCRGPVGSQIYWEWGVEWQAGPREHFNFLCHWQGEGQSGPQTI